MANKGQKLKKYSIELKEEILKKYWSGSLASVLAKEYGVPVNTIYTWNHDVKYLRNGNKRGRPKINNLTLEDYKERYEILKKYQAFLQARREKK